ncbi:hypothetical protein FJZ26_05955, partial [Candidatus Parvarchaeota archaeon]|nr:hypothetical protein [Candidatus Parvarchaeota archaeon]
MRKNENADGEIGFKISLFFALIAVALALPAVFADLSVTSYTLSPQTIKPGTSGLVTLTIANTGNTLVSGISLSATGSGKLFSNADIFVGDISPGGSTIISVPFSAQADAQPGIYNFQAKLTGSTPSSTSASATNAITQRTFTVPVTITNPAILQATAKSNLVYTDGTFTLEGTILNSGGAAGNARLYVGQATDPRLSLGSNSAQAPSSGFIAKQLPIYVGEIANRSSFSAEVTLASNISSGVYSMPIGVLYDDAVGNTIFDKMLVLVNVKRSSPDFAIQLENQNFSPGQRTNLKLKISNTGTRDASNLRIALGDSAALTPLGASVAKLDLLSHGQSAALQFEVGVNNALPGFYSIPFRISYQNDKGDEQPAVTQSAGMNIAVPAQVDF